MRILHTGDLHFEHTVNMPNTGLRGVNARVILDFIVEHALGNNIDAVLFGGDVFNTGQASHEMVESFVDGVRPLVDAGMDIVFIAGNHDVKRIPLGHRTPLHRLQDLGERVHVLFEIGSVTLSNGLVVTGFPWVSKKLLLDEKAIDLKADSLGEQNAWVTEFFVDELTDEVESSGTDIILGHFTVDQVLPEFRGSEVEMAGDPWEHIVPAKVLEDLGVKYVGLGHIHRSMQVGSNVWYAGSPERFTIRERDDAKGFKVVDLVTGVVETVATPARKAVVVESLGDVEKFADALGVESTIVQARSLSSAGLMVLSDALKEFPARLVSQRLLDDDGVSEGGADVTSDEVDGMLLSPAEGMGLWLPEDMRGRESDVLAKFDSVIGSV